MSDSLLDPLLRSPQLVEHIDQLNRTLAIESKKRRKFYGEITEDHKWEFINGQVIMHSPANNRHNRVVLRLARLLSSWCDFKQLGQVTAEKTLCQFPRNDYEPDIVFFGAIKAAHIEPHTLLHPVPDFIVEVLSPSTASLDRGVKFQDYAAHGVQEYWIIDPDAETIEQFVAANRTYPTKVKKQRSGKITSAAVAGFEIPVRAAFDQSANLAALRELLGGEFHSR